MAYLLDAMVGVDSRGRTTGVVFELGMEGRIILMVGVEEWIWSDGLDMFMICIRERETPLPVYWQDDGW
jgi:hypothetical protein